MCGRVALFAASFLAAFFAAASAQTISLVIDEGGTQTRSVDTTVGEPFVVITVLETGGPGATSAGWVQTDLRVLYPGTFLLGTVHLCPTCWMFIDAEPGQYPSPFGGCHSGDQPLEILRLTYGDFTGALGSDIVMTVRGFQDGDCCPSLFGGAPGYIDCDDVGHALEVRRGEAWQTGSGVIVPSGSVVLNPTPPLVVGGEALGMSHLKARFR